ncbi:uncharacterized protein DSM5745_01146 [Aspergillus mulundensis]|uniref:Uncharacterized protein n=1 Tax=Aspergillus mulundensis TaxID=1810919 RepID=A0A3D8T5M5_9EURO|nr:hypothetical protein DSM5745_01146 [Aspergillus mulundensis]RDW93824.1 hypothetical protein DSM5745_01146 [Aspergillus mulundensis]
MSSPLPPPPPPPTIIAKTIIPTLPNPPKVPPIPSPGSSLVSLLIYNGHPFKDHWAYFVGSQKLPNVGVKIHATGSVSTGFIFEIKRRHDVRASEDIPTKIVPLAWVDARYFDEERMLGLDGVEGGSNLEEVIDYEPVCEFERALSRVQVPEKSLVSVGMSTSEDASRRRVVQRDCQTWIVESADHLVRKGMFNRDVAEYLHAIQQ